MFRFRNPFGRLGLLALICILPHFASMCIAWAQDNAAYEASISFADGSYKRDNFAEALSHAQEAIKIDANRFEGHYFAALALLRLNNPRAEYYARQAALHAPADKKAVVDALAAAIKKQRDSVTLAQQARDAEAAGRLFLAATSYQSAYELDPRQEAVGLAAVKLWKTLKQPAKVARIYRSLARSTDSVIKNEAESQLESMAKVLADIWKSAVVAGWTRLDGAASAEKELEDAAEAFSRAIDAVPFPKGPPGIEWLLENSPFMGLIIVRAAQSKMDQLDFALRQGASNGFQPDHVRYFDRTGVKCSMGCKRDEHLGVLCQEQLQSAIRGIYGLGVERATKEFCQLRGRKASELAEREAKRQTDEIKRRAREVALAAEQKKAAEERSARLKEEHRRREQQREADIASIHARFSADKGKCYSGKAKAERLTACLCITGYEPAGNKVAYSLRVKGFAKQGNYTYEYDTFAKFESTWKADQSLSFIKVDVDTRPDRLNLGRSIVRVGSQSTITGPQAFWWSYMAATGRKAMALGDPLEWSMDVKSGAIKIGQRRDAGAVDATSAAPNCSN